MANNTKFKPGVSGCPEKQFQPGNPHRWQSGVSGNPAGVPERVKLQTLAASLVAEDELSDNEIARLCGVTRRTLMRWKKQPAIQRKIDEHLRLSKRQSEAQMLSERQQRIAHMDIRWRQLQDLIRKRASSPELRGVLGGDTGLLRRRVPFSGRHGGPTMYDYEVDTALLTELDRLEKAAAKALAGC